MQLSAHFHPFITVPDDYQTVQSHYMTNASNLDAWYEAPLDAEDVIAGGTLLLFAAVFVPLYGIVAVIMLRNDKDIVGFRFLFSAAVADVLLLINYGAWPGATILLKSEIIERWMRPWLQMYLDWAWFAMCYHYSLIAWSRFAAIKYPHSFRSQSRRTSYSLCLSCFVFAAIQVLLTHFQSWYVTFYYEPAAYGMLSEDFFKYLTQGQSLMFFSFHLLMVLIPIVFYTYAIALLIQHRRAAKRHDQRTFTSSQHHVESRLIIPCVFNSIVFIVGQVVITVGTGEGKWATWTVMLLFSFNSAVNPILYLFFSGVIRKRIMEMLGMDNIRKKNPGIPVYSTIMGNTVSPSPPSTAEEGSSPLRKKSTLVIVPGEKRYLTVSTSVKHHHHKSETYTLL
ncbi:hypothetical protein PENTCL1PPCAC_1102 [Pristionchus entomophagus]|uniref:G-protein coupled receptors family 1 profile domain-containing protein n=1 Tax=Pristionchus entomophagus TaxID=358040 RepID=A0AAV5S7K3_9BILA|nr:hypothetical protein PENTCL1PPCAC_1102 [Pristionchus entomophagus]